MGADPTMAVVRPGGKPVIDGWARVAVLCAVLRAELTIMNAQPRPS